MNNLWGIDFSLELFYALTTSTFTVVSIVATTLLAAGLVTAISTAV
jgi:hypothetical protein